MICVLLEKAHPSARKISQNPTLGLYGMNGVPFGLFLVLWQLLQNQNQSPMKYVCPVLPETQILVSESDFFLCLGEAWIFWSLTPCWHSFPLCSSIVFCINGAPRSFGTWWFCHGSEHMAMFFIPRYFLRREIFHIFKTVWFYPCHIYIKLAFWIKPMWLVDNNSSHSFDDKTYSL